MRKLVCHNGCADQNGGQGSFSVTLTVDPEGRLDEEVQALDATAFECNFCCEVHTSWNAPPDGDKNTALLNELLDGVTFTLLNAHKVLQDEGQGHAFFLMRAHIFNLLRSSTGYTENEIDDLLAERLG